MPDPFVKKAPTVATVETPDKANAALFGDLSLSINDESSEFGATTVASFLLGEGATSRLWKRIRERDGLSYGVYSYVGWNSIEPNTTLTCIAIFAPQNRARLATALNEEFARVARDGFTDAEVEDAQGRDAEAPPARAHAGRERRGGAGAAGVPRTHVRVLGEVRRGRCGGDAGGRERGVPQVLQPDGLALVYAGDFARHP